MLLAIVITWLVVNVLIVAFLVFHPLRHFSSVGRRSSVQPPATPSESPSPRSMV